MAAELRWRFSPVVDLTKSAVRRLPYRLSAKIGRMASRYAGMENRWQLGYTVSALCAAARRTNGDLFIAHSESGLVAAARLLA